MILNTSPQNEATLSNVGEIGEFRIRNSAKAFNILSSGLYANKIRAVIRELSCNAYDSHVAAGKKDTPFDVHLPNSLEPHFSIRDYGTGLSHEQVTQIYTTYFESTKTASNEFIGALGLGSKSPFSYTDNFTVTAVKDGSKRIYTAFINENGVPSIALMTDNDTDEPNGVEVQFSVNDRYDYDKFYSEAQNVYTHFSLRPVISGCASFEFHDIEYETRDIVPGVHTFKAQGRKSVAVMGNISYPIQVPEADTSLAELRNMLNCGLEIHFAIGELDFQASREGLSYIPQTIAAIKKKLLSINSALTVVLAKEADAIDNLWERAVFLAKKRERQLLWVAAVNKYATDTKLPTFDNGRTQIFTLATADLARDYNISIRAIQRSRNTKTVTDIKVSTVYGDNDATGHRLTWQAWEFRVSTETHFVINDTKTGAVERAKYHYRETTPDVYQRHVFVIEAADKNKKMDTAAFFAVIHSPPTANIFAASSLMQKERKGGVGKNVTILKLSRRGGYNGRRSDNDMVWRDAGKADGFDANKTFYYIPLSGFQMLSSKGYTSGKELHDDATSLPGLFNGEIYGVRKSDIDEIKKRPNWKNFEEYISTALSGADNTNLLMSLVKSKLNNMSIFNFKIEEIIRKIDATSPYALIISDLSNVEKFEGNLYNVERLFRKFAPTANLSPDALINKYQQKINSVSSRYPLLGSISAYKAESADISHYINLIDNENNTKLS